MANNFLTWNPECANQESDAAYTSDSQRSGGAVSGPFPSATANKLFFQNSIMIAALAGMLTNKGFPPNDGSAVPATALANLETVLANIITKADITGTNNLSGLSGKYYVKLGPLFGGLIIQFGLVSISANPTTVAFATPFTNYGYIVMASGADPGNAVVWASSFATVGGYSAGGLSLKATSGYVSGVEAWYFALGS